jgi:MYND finger/Ankyrin repeat
MCIDDAKTTGFDERSGVVDPASGPGRTEATPTMDLDSYEPTHCNRCGRPETSDVPLHECGTCGSVVYCSASCMKEDFHAHRPSCNQVAATLLCHSMHHGDRAEIRRLARHKRVVNTPIHEYRPPASVDGPESIYRDWTPLHECVRINDGETLALLLESGAKVNAVNAHQQTPLWLASSSLEVSVGIMDRLVQADGADPNVAADDGSTPLVRATLMGSYARAELLLKHGADPNVGVDDSGRSVMAIAKANAAALPPAVRLSHSSGSEVVLPPTTRGGEVAAGLEENAGESNEAKRLLGLLQRTLKNGVD